MTPPSDPPPTAPTPQMLLTLLLLAMTLTQTRSSSSHPLTCALPGLYAPHAAARWLMYLHLVRNISWPVMNCLAAQHVLRDQYNLS